MNLYNLFHEHNKDVHPFGEEVTTGGFVGCLELEQSKDGFHKYNDDMNIVAPFNTSMFTCEGKCLVQMSSIGIVPRDSVVIQFYSEGDLSGEKFPQSLLRACDYAESMSPKYGSVLKCALLGQYSDEINIDEIIGADGCWMTCIDNVEVLHSAASLQKEIAQKKAKNTKVSTANLAIKYNSSFGRDKSIVCDNYLSQGVDSFHQDERGITFKHQDEIIDIPVRVHCFMNEECLIVQISELMLADEYRIVTQFSSLIEGPDSTFSDSSADEAEKYILKQFKEYSPMLLRVLSCVYGDIVNPKCSSLQRDKWIDKNIL